MSRPSVESALAQLWKDVEALDQLIPVPVGSAEVPREVGVYVFFHEGELVYVGEALGSGGLADRIKSKHVSGDDNHACQRALREKFPNRRERRAYIKSNVTVRWLVVEDESRASALERLLIWLFQPPWNKK